MKIQNNKRLFNKINRTPLHHAAKYNQLDIGELLIAKGADVNAEDIHFLYIIISFLIKKILNRKRKK